MTLHHSMVVPTLLRQAFDQIGSDLAPLRGGIDLWEAENPDRVFEPGYDLGSRYWYVRGENFPDVVQDARALGTPDDYMDYVFGVGFAIIGMAVMWRIHPAVFVAGLPPWESFMFGVGVSNLIQQQF